MPPKARITKNDIIEAALELVRKSGKDSINTRSIAAKMGSSTQPIFSNFKTMNELEEAVIAAAYELYSSFLEKEIESRKYPEHKALGMAYIRFAKEEKELFKLLFMCNREGKPLTSTDDYERAVEIITLATGLSTERARLMQLELWSFVHGVATMFATSFLELDFDLISSMLTDVYQGIKQRHLQEEKK